MTIQETIAHLDELRKEEYGTTIHLMSEKPRKERLEFLSQLAENYDQLRKAALAGAKLAGAVKSVQILDRVVGGKCGELQTVSLKTVREKIDAALDTYKKSV